MFDLKNTKKNNLKKENYSHLWENNRRSNLCLIGVRHK